VFGTAAFVRLRDPGAFGFLAIFLHQGAGSDKVFGRETF
jgi:hypothetical protein